MEDGRVRGDGISGVRLQGSARASRLSAAWVGISAKQTDGIMGLRPAVAVLFSSGAASGTPVSDSVSAGIVLFIYLFLEQKKKNEN